MTLQRYDQLTNALAVATCRTLVEIGTWNGVRARDLVRAALRRSPRVTYHGFDLFEMLTDSELEAELSKRPPSRADVENGLRALRQRVRRGGLLTPWRKRDFDFALHQGYTRETLPAFRQEHPDFRADFIWIDGGHKVETIATDWEQCSQMVANDGAVYLDDYYGDKGLAEQFGCNQLIERLQTTSAWNVDVLPVTDVIPDLSSIQIVRVTPSVAGVRP